MFLLICTVTVNCCVHWRSRGNVPLSWCVLYWPTESPIDIHRDVGAANSLDRSVDQCTLLCFTARLDRPVLVGPTYGGPYRAIRQDQGVTTHAP
jgi:hypothetical protein